MTTLYPANRAERAGLRFRSGVRTEAAAADEDAAVEEEEAEDAAVLSDPLEGAAAAATSAVLGVAMTESESTGHSGTGQRDTSGGSGLGQRGDTVERLHGFSLLRKLDQGSSNAWNRKFECAWANHHPVLTGRVFDVER